VERLTLGQLGGLLERGELSVTVEHRRQTLIAIAELAKQSRGHTSMSRARLKAFRAALESEQNNDELEVTGEIFCEIVMHAMAAGS
jgi:hypothetical protein